MVQRIYEQVRIGPLYELTVKAMTRYRRVSSLMQRSSYAKQGAIDRRLEALDEEIGERLSELTHAERSALCCWKDGVERGFYEVVFRVIIHDNFRVLK